MSEQNVQHTGHVCRFDCSRQEFAPYGLTCEVWTPDVMRRPDRHNEIELNYLPAGSIAYLFQDRKVVVPCGQLAVFWGLIPHQIVHYEANTPYYVCTVPFSMFLEWRLPSAFTDAVLRGGVLLDVVRTRDVADYDEYLLKRMASESGKTYFQEIAMLELHARLLRMAVGLTKGKQLEMQSVYSGEISLVEQMAIYIARNYREAIKVTDVGAAVGLHPDYANALFKKTFGITLGEHIIEERIAHAQRMLVTGNLPVMDIAFECGFNSVSSFNAAFQKLNGCTPREFRKQCSGKMGEERRMDR